jgi:hypothetical protein
MLRWLAVMKTLTSSVDWVWALSILLQLTLFALLFIKHNFKKLPLLTAYMALNLCQAAYLLFLYSGSGASLRSHTFLAWASEAVTLVFQALAATEALRLVLGPYPGIWGLTWRVLAFISALLLAYVAAHAAGNYQWALLEADRGYHLIFATAIVCCLVLLRYYSVAIPAPYKLLLAGFCFFSCSTILINTLLQDILFRNFTNYEPIWQFASVFSFAAVQVIWIVALRKPLPEDTRRPALPSDELYQHLSPQLDQRLRLINEKLMRIWKLEARSQ